MGLAVLRGIQFAGIELAHSLWISVVCAESPPHLAFVSHPIPLVHLRLGRLLPVFEKESLLLPIWQGHRGFNNLVAAVVEIFVVYDLSVSEFLS